MMNKEMLVGVSAAVVFVIIGSAMFYYGIYLYNKISLLRSSGVVTKGIILRYETRGTSSTSSDKDKLVIPIVQFHTADGTEITFDGTIDNQSVLQDLYDSGEAVEVIYDPKHPADAKINTLAELWFAPLLLLIIGAAFIFFPPFTIWKHRKETMAHDKKIR